MRKLKVYLDTSVVSYLHQEDAPEMMKDTLALWDSDRTAMKYIFQMIQTDMRTVMKPMASDNFTVEDIRKLREYNSLRHIRMSPKEIVGDTRKGR